MYWKINEYLKQLNEECSMVVQKMVKELPALGLVGSVPAAKEKPEDGLAVMNDFDRFINDIMVSVNYPQHEAEGLPVTQPTHVVRSELPYES